MQTLNVGCLCSLNKCVLAHTNNYFLIKTTFP